MREIKFRAWDIDNKFLFDVYEIHFGNNFYIKGLGQIFSRNFNLMQYTGLKDKNGKEIYEGDIIEYFDEQIELVEWSKSDFWSGLGTFRISKVIGNIYENPELLEKTNE